MEIIKVRVEDVKPYEKNAKLHPREQIEQIKRSIQEFGNNDPIAIDENGTIIEGHGRFQALQELGYTEVECIRLTHLTDEQKRAYILVHNQLTMNTGFDPDLLEIEVEKIVGIDMTAFGFDIDTSVEFKPEDFGEESRDLTEIKEPRVKRGEVWRCGRHRIMCGDSTHREDVDKLIDGALMDLCITDPPYNVDYEDKDRMLAANGKASKTRETSAILHDSMDAGQFYSFLLTVYKLMLGALKPGGAFYVFHADSEGLNFRAAIQEAGGQVKQNIIWVKNVMTLGRQDYQWKHEPCLYGWKDGAGHYFTHDRCQTTVFEDKPDFDTMGRDELLQYVKIQQSIIEQIPTTVLHANKPLRSDLHPTMKPVALIQRLIQNSTRRGERVLDLFGGSGSTMMACEACGRDAYLMELDPHYCDVIIERWEQETGEKAVLINGDR